MIDPAAARTETEALAGEAASILDELADSVDVPLSRRIEYGEPGHVICDVADAGFDVVVVGSHGTGFWKRLLLGSVSNHVLHHAATPVLVVRDLPTD